MSSILVSDFDGTITRRDFFDLVRERWPATEGNDPWEKYVSGQLTHFEALAEIFRHIPGSEDEVLDLVGRMELDPALPKAVADLHQAGWEIVVASAGCEWYIARLLKEAGVELTVHANPGIFHTGGGLHMSLPAASPFFKESTGINKLAVVEDALARSTRVAFAGDGRPDLPAILLVDPTLRFARGWLAEELTIRGEPFHPFERWSQIAAHLLHSAC